MICDLHVHSRYSFDGTASIEEICRSAAGKRVDVVALTDHCDMTDGPEGIAHYLAHEKARLQEFARVRENAAAPELLYGIELGNVHDMPERTAALLAERKFDFIVGAVHFLSDGSDIYKLPYPDAQSVDDMFRDHFLSMQRLADTGGFDALAHLDYPLRMLRGKVAEVSVRQYRELIDPVLQTLVKKEIALELNTRGTYDWQHRVGPEDWVLRRYRELGGRLVTIGSDAHVVKWIGAGFFEALEALKRTGFDSYAVYRGRKPCLYPVETAARRSEQVI